MLTAKQRAQMRRELAGEYKRKVRERLRQLREALRTARAERRGHVRSAIAACRAGRLALRERVKLRRAEALAALRREIATMKADARAACGLGKRAPGERVRTAKAELEAERKFQREMNRIDRHNRERREAIRGASAKERRQESDDEVRQNIPDELVPLFERVKRGIKGSDRKTRTEAFFQYVEENPREATAAADAATDRLIAELEERERMGRVCLRSKATYAEVPF